MKKDCPVVLQTGFRIFFLGALFYSIISILFWLLFYILSWNIFVTIPITLWHAYEMIFGFTGAVIAGFLLTAVSNWTGRKTLTGIPLFLLFFIWCLARLFAFIPKPTPVWIGGIFNTVFFIYLLIVVSKPIIQTQQWKRQSAVLSKVILLLLANIIFYITLITHNINASHKTLLFSVYMIVSLILTISRRIIPFFIEKGIDYPVTLRNSRFLDLTSLVLLVVFSIMDVFFPKNIITPVTAFLLAVVHTLRLQGWHTQGIWKRPLLWILFVGYIFLILGFILKVVSFISPLSPDYALHSFTYGGIGVFCLGMMARVSWGHTGRNIRNPPPIISLIFITLILGACIRIFFPIFNNTHYALWISSAQMLWMLAFTLFLCVYFPILISKRPDSKFG